MFFLRLRLATRNPPRVDFGACFVSIFLYAQIDLTQTGTMGIADSIAKAVLLAGYSQSRKPIAPSPPWWFFVLLAAEP
jgi:hypothetical protein